MIPPGNKIEVSLERVENENDIQPPPPASTTSQESKVSRTSGVCIIYPYGYIQTHARKHSVTDGLLVNSPTTNQNYLYSNTFQLTYRCLSPARYPIFHLFLLESYVEKEFSDMGLEGLRDWFGLFDCY